MTMITTPLFSRQDYDGNIQLLTKTENETILIHIKDIEYYFYMGKLPGWGDEQFYNYMSKVLDKSKFTLALVKRVESESFVFEKQWTYLKIKGSYKDIKYLLSQETKQIQIQQNNYFLQNFTGNQLNKTIQVTELYYIYWYLFTQINKSELKGIDYLMYDNLRYPFRYVQQTIETVQSRYNINFQDTLLLQNYVEEEINGCKYDKKIIISINDIKQNEISLLNEHLQYYNVCMFDIENVVSKQETYEGWKKVLNNIQFMDKCMRDTVLRVQMQQNVQIKPLTYDGQMTLESLDDDYKEIKISQQCNLDKIQISNRCCDQNEIVCISFIISNFKGTILEKIALVRSKYEPDGEHATKVIIAQSEKELLQHVIQILGNKEYNIIMHFNGWDFDEKMVMARMLLHGLAEEYLATFNMENEFSEYDFTCQGVVKMTAAQTGMGLFQIINPLRFSFDVFQMNKRMSPVAEKLDNNSLDGLLKYYGLEGKEGVTYQQITDRFQRYLNRTDSDDIQQLEMDLKEVYDYCQFDSIQQTKLQTFLGLLLQQIQISVLTKVPLKNCVYNAVTQKVNAVVYDAYLKSKKMYTDVPNPFTRPFEPTTKQVENLNIADEDEESSSTDDEYEDNKKDKKYLQNKGGEVLCNETGFKQIISAIDAESMYPAQKEANNIDKSCLITAENMLYIINNKNDFGINDIKLTKLYDMYSPYIEENIQNMNLPGSEYTEICNLGYTNTKKTFRWQINIDNFCFQQFFFEKKNQCMPYTFVFLLQGKDLSPKAKMLTSFRVLRQAAKKQKKEAKEECDIQFYDSKQASFKLLCNSEYGANDAPFCHAFDMFESSLVTKQSRYIIQNARDMLQSPVLILPKTIDMKFIEEYNKFAQQAYNNPEVLQIKILNDDIKKILLERGVNPDE